MKAMLKAACYSLFVVMLLFETNLWGQEDFSETKIFGQQKVYVSPEQIEVTANGILFYPELGENPILGNSLSYDDHGLFVEIKQYYCPILSHGPKCKKCGGCVMSKCPCHCICYD
ncbi:MAG: hypothetical protein H7A38_02210 [Chlamydiales bacterium]|nr:hypothetical protein [Chlamydiales bacterium]